MMKHKGYLGEVSYDDDQELFFGRVLNTNTVITFQGRSVEELKKAFVESIEDYLAWCEEDGVQPEKAYSGRFSFRITPQLHKEIELVSKLHGFTSIN
jgi:predicted HicB family RNase H-like nuclease